MKHHEEGLTIVQILVLSGPVLAAAIGEAIRGMRPKKEEKPKP